MGKVEENLQRMIDESPFKEWKVITVYNDTDDIKVKVFFTEQDAIDEFYEAVYELEAPEEWKVDEALNEREKFVGKEGKVYLVHPPLKGTNVVHF